MTSSPVALAPGVYRWDDLRAHAEDVLAGVGVDSPAAEARWIVERAAGQPHPPGGDPAPARAVGHVVDMLERRVEGHPLQHVLGRWAFRRLELVVDHRALIPRVETEVVAEAALEEAVRLGATRRTAATTPVLDGGSDRTRSYAAVKNSGDPPLRVADLGTGSGVLALALVDELAGVTVWATDVSADALAVARANLAAAGLAARHVHLSQGSWFAALPGELRGAFHVIVSNPPYVAEHEFGELPPEVRDHEPREALVPGPTGLEALAEIVAGAPGWLVPGGALVLETAPHQAARAIELVRAAGFSEAEVRPDLAGRDRVLVARLPGAPGRERRAGGPDP